MNTSILNSLSKLQVIRSSKYFEYLIPFVESNVSQNHHNQFLNIYAAFIFATEPEPETFSGLDILNNEQALSQHARNFIGFVYEQTDYTLVTSYERAKYINRVFTHIAKIQTFRFDKIDIKSRKISNEVEKCIEQYHNLNLNHNNLDYLSGWPIKSKDGNSLQVNLDQIFCQYGFEFTDKIHNALTHFGLTKKFTTLKGVISLLCSYLLDGFTLNKNQSIEELKSKLSSQNVHHYFAEIMDIQFAKVKIQGNDEKTFYSSWKTTINAYTQCFIQTKVFDGPVKPFLTPQWKEPVNDDLSFSIGGKATKKETERWFGDIDLHIKDEEAVDNIHLRLNQDLNYIKYVCTHIFEETKRIHIRNTQYAREGDIKPLKNPSYNAKFPIGPNNIKNTVATFYHYGIGAENSSYIQFLKFEGKTEILHKELALPTRTTMNAILSLLVFYHPKITPSWLQEWELFDKNGNQTGYKQVGNHWVIVSFKNRRGVTLAQQEVILNDKTKPLVDFLIEHTTFSRARLKSLGNINWRKMIIVATYNKALIYKNLNHSLRNDPVFYRELKNKSWILNNSELYQEDINFISEIFTLRSLRRHRGLQIYLETESIRSVASALGHKEVDLALLETTYLPKPIMDFFVDRVIRQFQNSILFEAMRDSPYLLDAIDISEKNITEFLKNHGINNIPFHLGKDVKNNSKNKETDKAFDGVVFTISTALLQLLIAIKTYVEIVDTKTQLKEVVEHWYQCALLILSYLETDMYKEEEDYKQMLEDAKANPINSSKIMEALTC